MIVEADVSAGGAPRPERGWAMVRPGPVGRSGRAFWTASNNSSGLEAAHRPVHRLRRGGRAEVLRRGLRPACTCRSALPEAKRRTRTICEMPCSSQKGISSAVGGPARFIELLRLRGDETSWRRKTSSAAWICSIVPLAESRFSGAPLAGLADLGERLPWFLLDRDVSGSGAVTLVEVDVVGLQSLERSIDLLGDLLRGRGRCRSTVHREEKPWSPGM